MSRRILLWFLFAAAAWLATTGVAPPAPAADGDLLLTAEFSNSSPKLGDTVTLKLQVVNRGKSTVAFPELRLAQDSVSLACEFESGTKATVVRHYGEFVEEEGEVRFRIRATQHRPLESGAEATGRIKFVAAAVGRVSVTPRVTVGADRTVTCAPLDLRIQPRGGTSKTLEARVETTVGDFRIELDGVRSFNSVGHFVMLAQDGFYDGLSFHRVLSGVLAQTGDPRSDGRGLGFAGWYLPPEYRPRTFLVGGVGLARGIHVDSASSPWFVALTEESDHAHVFEPGYTSIGQVMPDDFPVLEAIGKSTAGDAVTVKRVVIGGR
jgi:cyclophilin family peptidyl-prolyl cis-trans isomerase